MALESFLDRQHQLAPKLMAVLAVAVLGMPVEGITASVSGTVVSVLDGDTLEVFHHDRSERIRLHGIDCPEKGQAFGSRAKEAASVLAFGKEVVLHARGKDKYRRTVADVLLPDGTNLNQRLVQDGWCWWYEKHAPKDLALQQSQQEAKAAKRGLWADANPVPPWLYRRLRSGVYP